MRITSTQSGPASIPDGVETSVGDVPMDRLHAVFDGMFDGVWMVSPEGRTTYANEAMAGLLGLSRASLLGRSIRDFLDDAAWEQAAAFLERQRSTPGERVELLFRRPDGRDVVGLLAGSPIVTAEGAFVGTMLNFSDVTGKRAHEVQVAQDEKMRAIGEFAGGLAHDFNNILTAIRGHAELARMEAGNQSSIVADLDAVIENADRASGITRKLLAFTRRQILEPMLLDPAQAISRMMPNVARILGDEITLVEGFTSGRHWVMIDPVHFELAILTLVVNAREAMPAGGTVTISVKDWEQPRSERPERDMDRSAMVRITVADTGHGMDDETRARIFDPFFTTKPLGKGTGLGLPTVFGIVTQSGGSISVESSPGNGATFVIDLPSAAAPRDGASPTAKSVASDVTSATVLLVEDEPAVREFARRVLERAGHTVLTASGGLEAVRQSDDWDGPINVLVSDVMMGEMNGPQMVGLLRARRPGVGVIFMSGYAREILDSDDPGAYDGFLAKPFNADDLVASVARVLGATQPAGDVPRGTPVGRRPGLN